MKEENQKDMIPEQDTFRDSPELRECLKGLPQSDEGYYTVSSLAQLGVVLRKLQKEKARQEQEEQKDK